MPTIIPPSFGLVAHSFRISAQQNPSGPMVITYGVNVGVAGGQAVLDLCCDYMGSVVEGCVADNYEMYFSTLKQGPNETGPTFEDSRVVSGGTTGVGAVPNTAMLVRKVTGLGGRSNRGRLYLPGVSTSVITDTGQIGSTALGDYQEVWDTWLTGLDGEGITPVILHSSSSDPTAITSMRVEPVLATQRRRLR